MYKLFPFIVKKKVAGFSRIQVETLFTRKYKTGEFYTKNLMILRLAPPPLEKFLIWSI